LWRSEGTKYCRRVCRNHEASLYRLHPRLILWWPEGGK
jgi:hypothetical protein